MSTTIVTSLELSLDIARAKKAAKSGPVVITDRGKPAHVLLSIEYYRRLTNAASWRPCPWRSCPIST